MLSAELSQSGWLDFGAFRWRDLAVSQAARATAGVMVPLVIGVASGTSSTAATPRSARCLRASSPSGA